MQILTSIIPLLPTLQKVPLHIASTEANLKEAIRKSAAAPPIASTQPISTGSTSGSRKRKPSKNADRCTPSPSVARRKRLRIDSSFAAQQQLPSPKSSHESLLAQSGLSITNHHRSIDDALRSSSRPAPGSVNVAQTPNSRQRLSMQPPSPRIIQTTPSRRHSIFPPEGLVQPTSSHPHKRESTLDASVPPFFAVSSAHSATPVPSHRLNHFKDAFRLPTQFHIHTPVQTDSGHLNDQPVRPSAPPPSPVGFSAVRCRMTHKHHSVPYSPCSTFLFA
jgi:hypothetical protein